MHKVITLNKRGFTLIETLVAISILLLSILGPMTFAAQGIQNTYYARDQIVAFYLAQEGIELVRAKRDDNALSGAASWLTDITGSTGCDSADGCGVEVQNQDVFVPCGASPGYANCRMYYDASGVSSPSSHRGIYVLPAGGGVATTFVRRIQVQSVSANEYDVVSVVSWQTARLTKTITVRSKIFNQYDNL